ncbi:hypothetical protein ACFPT7_04510 [Acidicapsa dinghuensis]|uniref:Uncharacterized protein n=1 Tax=Acidicapsa dinghuensis TaxID=2218256 RepID=A0ABW1ECI4_9BACT|nr:hypothetical protein [Acidicapsa dinghuensis]
MKLRELDGWPPQSSGIHPGSYVVPKIEQAMLKGVVGTHRNWVTFVCSFEGTDHTYDFEAPDKGDALRIEKILKNNIGKSILEIGEIQFLLIESKGIGLLQ